MLRTPCTSDHLLCPAILHPRGSLLFYSLPLSNHQLPSSFTIDANRLLDAFALHLLSIRSLPPTRLGSAPVQCLPSYQSTDQSYRTPQTTTDHPRCPLPLPPPVCRLSSVAPAGGPDNHAFLHRTSTQSCIFPFRPTSPRPSRISRTPLLPRYLDRSPSLSTTSSSQWLRPQG